ncbi:MAG TPA: permease [Verrucomicrobiaceae bacterium]|jgi:uncharacterized membrane protein YraQ (UPF0718 family)
MSRGVFLLRYFRDLTTARLVLWSECHGLWRDRPAGVRGSTAAQASKVLQSLRGAAEFGTMNVAFDAPSLWVRWRCPHRAVILIIAVAGLLCSFWIVSRYPQLFKKAEHVGGPVASMAFGSELLPLDAAMPWWQKIAFSAVNWLDSMKIGMGFAVAFGALLHTILKYFPLRIGSNLYLNSVKGAIVGVPAGVCANCSVPVACGVTRGNGRVEVALGFLFSSPNFNPVVVLMTFTALPLSMAATKYAILLLVITLLVPGVIAVLERRKPMAVLTIKNEDDAMCEIVALRPPCEEKFGDVLAEVWHFFMRHVWMLLRPTLAIMLLASLASAVLLVLVPWPSLLANTAPVVMLLVALLATFMPVPIALDVMFAALLLRQGVAPGYVMLFAMTLGIYSIVPSIYLWREVSRALSVILFVFFALVGWICGMLF